MHVHLPKPLHGWRAFFGEIGVIVIGVLTALAAVTLLLSLGPYAPGFRYLITQAGFNFFRAPSRWSVATGLALVLLAGKGFDRWLVWAQPGRGAVVEHAPNLGDQSDVGTSRCDRAPASCSRAADAARGSFRSHRHR